MNKLSALVSDRTGNSSRAQYQSIQDGTENNATATGNLEYGRTDSGLSGLVGGWTSFLRRYACTLAFITSVVILLALQGQRAAHNRRRPATMENHGGDDAVASILRRPCQFYDYPEEPGRLPFGIRSIHGGPRRMPRVVQTSLGEPANQWGEVACMYYYGGGIGGGTAATMAADVREYGLPTAGIGVDFAAGPAFPKREAILGFGGAFTEATALNYRSLSKRGREAVMELLFGSTGLGYR